MRHVSDCAPADSEQHRVDIERCRGGCVHHHEQSDREERHRDREQIARLDAIAGAADRELPGEREDRKRAGGRRSRARGCARGPADGRSRGKAAMCSPSSCRTCTVVAPRMSTSRALPATSILRSRGTPNAASAPNRCRPAAPGAMPSGCWPRSDGCSRTNSAAITVAKRRQRRRTPTSRRASHRPRIRSSG